MYLTIQIVRYDFSRPGRVREPPYVTLDGSACDRFAWLAAAAGLFVPSPDLGRLYNGLRVAAEPRDPDSDGPADRPPTRPQEVTWRDYNRMIDEWRASSGLHNGERAFVLGVEQSARLAAVLDAPDLGDRLVTVLRAAGLEPVPSARELRASLSTVQDRVRPALERAAALGQGLWITESS